MGGSSALIERFTDVVKVVKNNATVPGTFINCNFEQSPLTYGVGEKQDVFFRGNTTFGGGEPLARIDSLSAGYVNNFQDMDGNIAMARVDVGTGEVIVYAFLPQYRASVDGSFLLFFNALYE